MYSQMGGQPICQVGGMRALAVARLVDTVEESVKMPWVV